MRMRTEAQAAVRFWNRVIRLADCWVWMGATWGNNGYGCMSFRGKQQSAHRIAWRLANGEITADKGVLHRCDNPLCVNPAHLFLGSQKDNMQDAKAKGRTSNQHAGKQFCKRGHEFTPENTRHDGRGRQCRACDVIRGVGK